jgi:hypothetical protein
VYALLRQEGIGMFHFKAPIEFGIAAGENA